MINPMLPITELNNEFSNKLDGASASDDFLRILRAADAQVFSGWREYPSLFDHDILQQCERVAQSCAKLLRLCMSGKDIAIVMTGCGTSGRIAYLTARRFNQSLRSMGVTKSAFYYLISGGDSALLLSDELPEDDPVEGASDLASIVERYGNDGYFLIGVTCGLAAPYVAGQIDYVIRENESSKSTSESSVFRGAAVLGFNPPGMARDVPIEKAEGHWTFRDVAVLLDELRRAEMVGAAHEGCTYATLTPVVGPEPVGGSSRMKGGSATAVVLDAICRRALQLASSDTSSTRDLETIEELCLAFQRCHMKTYAAACRPPPPLPPRHAVLTPIPAESAEYSLCRVMECAALALRDNCRLYYVGTESAGCMGCIDVSEMPDTYGSPFDQVRAFVEGGWGVVANMEGDLSHVSSLHRISTEHFRMDVLSNLRENDAVVFVLSGDDVSADILELVSAIQKEGKGNMCLLRAAQTSYMSPSLCLLADATAGRYVNVNHDGNVHDGLLDYSIKLLLNAVSTFAQASGRGAVYRGLMVSTGPANDKIYARCVRLLADSFPGVSLEQAEHSLIKSIHGVDCLTPELLKQPTSFHIQASILPPDQRHCAQIALPLAMLLLSNDVACPGTEKWTVASGRRVLAEEPRIGIILRKVFAEQATSSSAFAAAAAATTTKEQKKATCGNAIVFDLGGTHVRGARAVKGVLDGDIICQKVGSDKSIDAVMSIIGEVYSSLTQSSPSFTPECVVMAQPGCVDNDKGTVSALANYPWQGDVSMRDLLRQIVQDENVVISLMDDANAALLGELSASGLSSSDTVCMLTIGTGVGSSVCIKGALLTGGRGLIEGGHQIVVLDGRPCACGQKGCIEAYASGPAVAQIATERGVCNEDGSVLTAEDVVEAAHNGQGAALATLLDASRYLAVACVNMVRLYDPTAIIIGGGLSAHLISGVRSHYKELSWSLHNDLSHVQIIPAQCGEPGIAGAIAFSATL
jgi:predicted NBD/HSP70 family sugar kinase/N-acetylmuramic acid 6-phosphate (MurNAc-6-P) etherase